MTKEEKQKLIKEYKEQHREKEIQDKLIEISKKYEGKTKLPKDLCYLEGKLRENYLHDMKIWKDLKKWAETISDDAYIFVESYDNEHHKEFILAEECDEKGNNADKELLVISAKKGEKVLIPMNMRDGCIIGIGKGNDDWNQSAPHGAGRIMSRMKAKETFNLDEYKESMKDIYTTSVNENTIDEAPFVYKPTQEIIDNISDTADIIKIIKPIYNFKASD